MRWKVREVREGLKTKPLEIEVETALEAARVFVRDHRKRHDEDWIHKVAVDDGAHPTLFFLVAVTCRMVPEKHLKKSHRGQYKYVRAYEFKVEPL